MKTAYYIKPWQELPVSVFIDKFGIDKGGEMIQRFEKHGSLGRAMIKTVHKNDIRICGVCKSPKVIDLTHGYGPDRNYLCHDCKAHFWQGRWWKRKEWDDYLEEVK